jgi:Ni,Fe-hydrogenase I cytochrome b subunit
MVRAEAVAAVQSIARMLVERMGFVFIGFVLSELFWFVERNSAAKEQGKPRQEIIF